MSLALIVGLAFAARRRRPAPLRLDVAVSAPLATGGVVPAATCILGSDVSIRASGATALWVYREDVLIASCPGEACRSVGGALELTFRPTLATRHRIVAVAGPAELASTRWFDRDLLRARTHGARLELRILDVVTPR